MNENVLVIQEAGYWPAMTGLSLNKNVSIEKMPLVAEKLAVLDQGHNKFLEHIYMWLLVKFPRLWWSQADTYRITSKQSESTMHTCMRRLLTKEDFVDGEVIPVVLGDLNVLIDSYNNGGLNNVQKSDVLYLFKKRLPEGFLQTREWCMSYKEFRNIIIQRSHHKIGLWKVFIDSILSQLEHPELLPCPDDVLTSVNQPARMKSKGLVVGNVIVYKGDKYRISGFPNTKTLIARALVPRTDVRYVIEIPIKEITEPKFF